LPTTHRFLREFRSDDHPAARVLDVGLLRFPDAGADRVKALTAPVKIGVAQSGTEIARKIRDAADTVALGPVDA